MVAKQLVFQFPFEQFTLRIKGIVPPLQPIALHFFMMPADKLDPVDASQCDRIRIKTDPVCWQISYKPFNPF